MAQRAIVPEAMTLITVCAKTDGGETTAAKRPAAITPRATMAQRAHQPPENTAVRAQTDGRVPTAAKGPGATNRK